MLLSFATHINTFDTWLWVQNNAKLWVVKRATVFTVTCQVFISENIFRLKERKKEDYKNKKYYIEHCVVLVSIVSLSSHHHIVSWVVIEQFVWSERYQKQKKKNKRVKKTRRTFSRPFIVAFFFFVTYNFVCVFSWTLASCLNHRAQATDFHINYQFRKSDIKSRIILQIN